MRRLIYLLIAQEGKIWVLEFILGFICYYIFIIVSDSNSYTYLGFINSF
jgi:hypothetical protein